MGADGGEGLAGDALGETGVDGGGLVASGDACAFGEKGVTGESWGVFARPSARIQRK